jgi:hypothetical protein
MSIIKYVFTKENFDHTILESGRMISLIGEIIKPEGTVKTSGH